MDIQVTENEVQDISTSPLPISNEQVINSASNSPVTLPIHVNARGLALGLIASITFIFALQWAQKFLVPLILAIFIAYTINPLVKGLQAIKFPRLLSSVLVTIVLLSSGIGIAIALQGQFVSIIEALPEASHKLSRLIETTPNGQPGALEQMQSAATEIVRAANSGSMTVRPVKKVVAAEAAGFKVIDWVWAGSLGMLGFVGQATMVIFLVFFLLVSGDAFKRKLVKLTGPSLHQKKITVHILDEINTSIQNYMFMLLVTNVMLALCMWLMLHLLGVENAGAWAVAAGLLHIMPYFGSLIATAMIGLAAFLQFESLQMLLLVAGLTIGIASLIGTVVTTWMTGRIAKMNSVAVFVSLLFGAWLWGVSGMLLGVPMIVILKVVAERLEGLEFIAELLAE
ncbi:AI-2E family transporter [Undibacterium seohonense]|uniref:AI-2E family transporter n=1 Tax=Undibacterium seohonense TaxID=1344950 RepID=A0ABR6X524_9BURK|nr:AI-2E family transporter [Undibacterium seohonense]MBC3808007.1 AI-2E family transporter [Undibacterium seohonense]